MTISLSGHQLYRIADRDFSVPHFVDDTGAVCKKPAGGIPMLFWPDGRWCHPANSFIRDLLDRGLSTTNRGGTLTVSAAHISLLLRYCWTRQIDITQLTDSGFCDFVRLLRSEVRPGSRELRRTSNSTIAIGHTCLAFLDFVGRSAGIEGFVSPDGIIKARKTAITRSKPKHPERVSIPSWDHSSLPKPSAMKRRLPIGQASIDALREAVGTISTSGHQRKRRHTMLKALECTGSRRGEIALLQTSSIEQAMRMSRSMITLPLLKRRDSKERQLPIGKADLEFIKQYVDVHRRSVMRRKYKGKADHGYVFVSETTGEPIQPNTVTQEVRLLAKAAGIEQKACPHMFRHRFFTKIFVMLIKQFTLHTPDEFRRALLDNHTLRRKAIEWTGHKRPESLEVYVDLAFDELTNADRVTSMVEAELALDAFGGTLDAEMLALRQGENPQEVVERLKTLAESLKRDLVARRPSDT